MLVTLPRRDSATVVAALAQHICELPKELRRSLTWNQGKEMAAHKSFTVATDVQVFFAASAARGNAAPTKSPSASINVPEKPWTRNARR